MKVSYVLLLVLIVSFFNLYAEQQNYYPKGVFEYSPPSRLRDPKRNTPGQKVRDVQVWNDGFESNNGWVLNGCWQRGSAEIGPSAPHTGSACLGTNLNGLYPNNCDITAISPAITLPAASYIELSFFEWFELESGYDFGYIEVVTGSNYRLDARSGTSGNEWRQTALNLTQFAGQQITLVFHMTSDVNVPGAGWYLDDVNIVAQEPLPFTLDVTGVNTANHPSIYISAMINSPSGSVNDLTTSNFSITENEIPQTTNLTVITPANAEQFSTADIVFVLDVTGSMSNEIDAVKQNMLAFVNSLTTQNVDYRIGLVVFGDIVYVYNNYDFYDDQSQILSIINAINLGEHNIGGGGDYPENQVEAMAEGSLFSWRPGAARVQIMLTDAATHQNDGVTPWNLTNLLAERLLPNGIIVFPIFDIAHTDQMAQYVPIAEATNPEGTYFDVYDNFNAIISQISTFIGNIYTIHYTSNTPLESPITRIVRIQATVGTETAEAYCYYLPGVSPVITRTDQITGYDSVAQPTDANRLMSVLISDIVPPLCQSVWIYWRRTGETFYTQTLMTMVEPGYYTFNIPAVQMNGVGIEYYFGATDGQSANTLPSASPVNFPYSFAIAPNAPALINITSQSYHSTSGLAVSVAAGSAQALSLKLYYRPMGSLVYEFVSMTHTTGMNYTANVANTASDFGMQFFIKATAANGLVTYRGWYDQPYLVYNTLLQDIDDPALPVNITNLKCQPNPVSPMNSGAMARISFELNKSTPLTTRIYNLRGERVRTLAGKDFAKGQHSLWWDLKDDRGKQVGCGLYLYVLQTADQKLAGKLLILK